MTTPNSSRLSWARLLAEAVAIVVSILIAFGLDAWWDESREAAEERRHLVAIAADFEANQALVVRYENMYGEVDRGTRELIEMLEGRNPEVSVSVPDSLLTAPAFVATYDPSRSAYGRPAEWRWARYDPKRGTPTPIVGLGTRTRGRPGE